MKATCTATVHFTAHVTIDIPDTIITPRNVVAYIDDQFRIGMMAEANSRLDLSDITVQFDRAIQ